MNLHVPPGHPYSPISSPTDIERTPDTETGDVGELPGIDLRTQQQWDLLNRLLPLYPHVADLLRNAPRYDLDNTWFAGADAVFMALMLCHLRPSRVIEVGCGYSSALLLDTLPEVSATMIDPDPKRLLDLVGERPGIFSMPVQDVPLSVFDQLQPGDVLAIDSSHVLKAGSDVHHLLFTVLPRLPQGVYVHVHDIFYPFEYPRRWLDRGVSFTEAYAWRALLLGRSRPRIELWNHYLIRSDRAWFEANMPLALSAAFLTGGLWVST